MTRQINAKVDERGNVIFEANDIDPLCDFCCGPEEIPVAALLVETREINPKLVSEGEWYICRCCLECVMSHDANALVERSIQRYVKYKLLGVRLPPPLYAMLRADTMRIHSAALDQLAGWPSIY